MKKKRILWADYVNGLKSYAFWIQDFLEDEYEDKYEIEFLFAHSLNEILELAKKQSIDLFILILNNMRDSYDKRTNIYGPYEVIEYLKHKYGKPIIAFSGYVTQETPSKAINSGASFFFELGSDFQKIINALQNCLGN